MLCCAPRAQAMLAGHMAASAAAHAGPGPRYTDGRNPMAEDTDTRFETESDVMELCDLAEVRRARMPACVAPVLANGTMRECH